MSRADYRRPADYQVLQVAKCSVCGREGEYQNDQVVDGLSCACGGILKVIGESHPANPDDWDEERDTQDGEWHRRR